LDAKLGNEALLQPLFFFQPKSVAWVLVHTEDPLGEDYHIKEPGSSWQFQVKGEILGFLERRF
jgi:hypothetical protein